MIVSGNRQSLCQLENQIIIGTVTITESLINNVDITQKPKNDINIGIYFDTKELNKSINQ